MTNNLYPTRTESLRRVARKSGWAAFCGFWLLTLCAGSVMAQPANDDATQAEIITGVVGSVTGSNVGATEEAGEPSHWQLNSFGASVWYRWTAPSNTLVTFDTVGSDADFDTVMAVYTDGPAFNTMIFVDSDDDGAPGGNLKSQVTFNALAGVDYFIAVDGYDYGVGAEMGAIQLNWVPGAVVVPTPGIAGVFNFSAGRYTGTDAETQQTGLRFPDDPGVIILGTRNTPGVLVTVTRTAGTAGRVLVDYSTINTNTGGTCGDTNSTLAVPGCDFFPTAGTLVFDDFQMSASFVVQVASDRVDVSGNKLVFLSLSNPRADTAEANANPGLIVPVLGPRATSTIQILELNATTPFNRGATNFVIERASYSRTEGGSIRVEVLMPSGSGGSVRFFLEGLRQRVFPTIQGSDYAMDVSLPYPSGVLYTDGTTNFVDQPDFTSFSTTLVFAPPPAAHRRIAVTIDLPLTPDVEFNEDILVRLEQIPGQPPVGANGRANITLLSNDQPSGALDRDWNPDLVSFTTPRFNPSPGANNTVRALAVQVVGLQDERTVIGGDFTAFNSFPRNRIARINPDGSLDESFDPQSGANNFVASVAVYPPAGDPNSGKILAAGGFTSMNSIQRNGVARLNADGSLDTSFNPGVGADGFVRSVALQSDGKILVAGEFTHFNGLDRNGVARLNADGSVDDSFNPGLGVDGIVWSVAVRDGSSTIFVPRAAEGEEFEDVNEIETGSTQGTIVVDYDYLTIPDNIRVYYDGVRIFNVTTNGIGQHQIQYGPGTGTKVTIVLNEGTGEPGTLWRYSANVITPPQTRKIFIGGEFAHFDGIFAGGVARLNDDGSVDIGYDPGVGVDGVVYTVAPQNDGRLVIGGYFSSVDFRSRNNIARLEYSGTLDLSYDPGTGANDTVYSVAFQRDGKALVGGLFTSFNGTRRMGLTRLFYNGTVDTSFLDTAYNQFAGLINNYNFQTPNYVNAVAVESSGNVMIGGSFTQAGGSGAILLRTRADKRARRNVARLLGGYTPGPGNVEYRYTQNTTDEHTGVLSLAFRRTDGLLAQASARVTTSDNVAESGPDYASAFGSVAWPQSAWLRYPDRFGDTDESYFFIPINEDLLVEGDEPFDLGLIEPLGTLNLGGEIIPAGLALGRSVSSVTIVDNDFDHGTLNFSSPTYTTNENAVVARIPVVRTNGSSGLVQVRYYTRDGSAIAGQDYYPTNGTLSFSSLTTTQYINVALRDDFTVEPDESFSIVLTNATSGASLPVGSNYVVATVTLYDNDLNSGRVNFASASYSTNEGAGVAQITLTRLGGIAGQLSVSVAATNRSAVSGADYLATTNTVTWVSGDSTPKTFPIVLLEDSIVETNETIGLRIFNPSVAGAVGSVSNATLAILDNDFYGALSFGQPVFDVDERGTNASIIVVRTGGVGETVSVDYRVVDNLSVGNPALAGTHYVATSGTLVFGPGVMATNFSVSIINGGTADGELQAAMLLTNFVNASPGFVTNASLQIIDDESVGDPAGLADSTFDPFAGGDNGIYTLDLQPDGRLMVGGDFSTLNRRVRNRIGRLTDGGTLDSTFNPGLGPNAAVRSLVVQPDGRVLVGGFFNSVAGTNRNRIARFLPDGTLDRYFDPGSGADNPVYTLALLADDRIVVGGAFVTVNGLPRPGVAVLETNGTVSTSFNPGTGVDGTVFAVAVQLDGKILIGGEFSLINDVARPRLARLNPNGSVDTTFDAGTGPSGSVRAIAVQADGRILIGGSFTNVNGTVRGRLARLNSDGSVDSAFLNSVDGGDGDVLALALQNDGRIVVGGDFKRFNGVTRNRITRLYRNGKTDPSINFGSGFNGFVSSVLIQPDRKIVLGGSFTTYDGQTRLGVVRLHGGSIAGPGGLEFQTPEFVALENSTNATIIVRRVGGTTGDVTVDYQTVNGTAIAGSHYQAAAGTLTFLEGETQASFLVPLVDNSVITGDLLLGVELIDASITGGAVSGPQPVATVRIVDDEGGLGFSVSSFSVSESVPSLQAVITVRRSGSTNSTSTVDFATLGGGTATAFADYIPTNGTLTFLPGQTTRTFAVRILDDALIDGNETIFLNLNSPSGGIDLGLATATLTIFDNEFSFGQFVFGTTSYTVAENGGSVFLTIIRTNGTTGIASVGYQTRDGLATAGLDYTSLSNVVAFADGESFKVIQVDLLDDLFVEDPETFTVRLLNPTGGATLGSVSNTVVVITENDVSQIIPVSSSLDAESVVPANGIIDSNETVTVSFVLRNVGSGDTSTNLVATLLAINGVTSPSAPTNYGSLIANGPAVSRQFTFRAVGNVGDRLVATLQLTDGPTTNGLATFAFTIGGQASRAFSNTNRITINDNTSASPYPATVDVSNMGGTITRVSVTLTNFIHSYPDDVDILLVGPSGEKVTLISDAGGTAAINAPGVSMTFADNATNTLPDAGPLLSRTYRPANYAAPGLNTADTFALPAPRPTVSDPFPYTNTSLAVFNGTIPNGTWSLFVVDDGVTGIGSIAGWSLSIQTSDPVAPTPVFSLSDLAVAAAGSSTVVVGATLNSSLIITNRGPATANDVALLQQMPAGLTFVSASASAGSWTKVQNTLTWTVGAVPSGGGATLTVVTMPMTPGTLTTTAAVNGNQSDPNPANNNATMQTTVIAMPVLTVSRQGNAVRIAWPAASGFILQGTGSLAPAGWLDVGAAPQVINGENVVTLGVGGGAKFYRLRSP